MIKKERKDSSLDFISTHNYNFIYTYNFLFTHTHNTITQATENQREGYKIPINGSLKYVTRLKEGVIVGRKFRQSLKWGGPVFLEN